MQYTVIFDAAHAEAKGLGLVAVGIAFAVVGLLFLFASRKIPMLRTRLGIKATGLLFLFVGITSSWSIYRAQKVMGEYGSIQVVEGPVSDFEPMPAHGHGMESFCVRASCFHYSDYVLTPGFNETSVHGGPIGPGVRVRVTHVGNTILKLEIAH